jgi:phospholipase/lecithinase/hemolysin
MPYARGGYTCHQGSAMPRLRPLFLAVLALGILATNVHAQQSYSALYAFGDSLTDTGNDYILSLGTAPATPYWQGRFSNGPIWLDGLAANLGLNDAPALAGGTNYAFGGAMLLPDFSASWGLPSVTEQVEVYLLLHNGAADPKALYVLEGGNNDVIAGTTGDPYVLGNTLGGTLYALAVQLSNAGARHIMVANVTDVGRMPQAAKFSTWATQAAQAANNTLAALLSFAWYTNPGTNFTLVDTFDLMDNLVASPGVYGLSNVNTPCLQGSNECGQPAQYLFWDVVHPTTETGAFLTNLAMSELP